MSGAGDAPASRDGDGVEGTASGEATATAEEGATTATRRNSQVAAITFWSALKIPGVVEFSLCLFFAKLVSYTFLYWLPTFIKESGINVESDTAANLSTLFDVGGIIGGIIAGLAADFSGKP